MSMISNNRILIMFHFACNTKRKKGDGLKFYKFLGFLNECTRVSVQGVKSLGGQVACLCRDLNFMKLKKKKFWLLFFKKKMEIILHFSSFL